MLPLASTRLAPKDWKIAPAVSTLSSVTPSPMPKGNPALWQASAALSIASKVQASAFRGAAAGIHAPHVDAGMLLHQVDARARSLDLAADGRRYREPGAVGAGEVFDGGVHRAVLLDELGHDLVDRLEVLGVRLRLPGREGENVVAGARLRLGG